MRLFYPFFFLLCLLAFSTRAQYQLRKATLTDTQKRQRTGQVRYYDWNKNPSTIDFSPTGTTGFAAIPVAEISELIIDQGGTYAGLLLHVPYYTTVAVLPSESIITRTDSGYFLGELLLDSPLVRLYRFLDANKATRYVIGKNDSLILLHDIRVPILRRQGVYTYEEPAYRRELKAALSECPTLNTAQVRYSVKSLIALLSEYLSFCRATPKARVQEKAFAQPLVDLGVSGYFLARVDEFKVSTYVATVQVLLPKQFHNVFVMLDAGRTHYNWEPFTYSELMIGLFAGRYIGRGALQGKLYTGVTTATGFLDTGVGLSYKKLISIEGRYPIVSKAINGFRTPMSPFLAVRALVPLSKGKRTQPRQSQ